MLREVAALISSLRIAFKRLVNYYLLASQRSYAAVRESLKRDYLSEKIAGDGGVALTFVRR